MATKERQIGVVAADELGRIEEYRREKNTSVLVIMFTDIQGSTQFAETHGEQSYNALRTKHNSILLEIIERGGAGRFVKNIGDAIMAIFAKPSDAVERALEIQRALVLHNTSASDNERIQVRIGLHMGQVALEESTSIDVFGRHVNRAARIEAIAKPGHILLTKPVYDSAKGWLDSKKYEFTEYGEYLLKGIPEPIEVIEVSEYGVTQSSAPLFPSTRDRINRMPVASLLITFVTIIFALCLFVFITPAIQSHTSTNTLLLTDGWHWVGNVNDSMKYIGEYPRYWTPLFLLLLVLVGIQLTHKGILLTYRRSQAISAFNALFVLYTAIAYFAATVTLVFIAQSTVR